MGVVSFAASWSQKRVNVDVNDLLGKKCSFSSAAVKQSRSGSYSCHWLLCALYPLPQNVYKGLPQI